MSNERRTITPPVSILDSAFQYTSALHTDLRKTFAKIRAQEKAKQTVVPIKRKEAR